MFSGNGGRRRRKQNPRFLTQPITVDEVEKARKGFMEPGARVSPLGGARTSPLYSMLRPVSLEEIGRDKGRSDLQVRPTVQVLNALQWNKE